MRRPRLFASATRRAAALTLLAALACRARAGRAGADAAPAAPADAARPNVIVVLVDDMGYGDPASFGNARVATPNIDRLAAEGTRFTQYYANSPICSPSRVAITTGQYPSRWRVHSYLDSRAKNRARGMADWLDPAAPTLARTLKGAGYATAHVGKWHMGGGRDVGDAPLPQAYGFDESLTSFEGLGDRYLWPDLRPGGFNQQSERLGRGAVRWTAKSEMTRHYVDRAVDFMRRHRDRPFYLNVWPNDVHDEFEPRPGAAAAFRAAARSDEEAKFFAVLANMDRELGRLLAAVDSLGLAERTVVVFTSDNGPTDWPRYYRAGGVPPGSAGPFRGRKWSLHEGGIRMPLIVRWPGRTPAGRVDSVSLFSAVDLVPALARVAGVAPPAGLDGQDVSAALRGRPASHAGPLYWYYPNDIRPGGKDFLTPPVAVRDGRWKLLADEDGGGARLYDLAVDPGETRDLAASRPAEVAALGARAAAWRRSLPAAPTSAAPAPPAGR
jgi:arylsulfatase A-like enzyme